MYCTLVWQIFAITWERVLSGVAARVTFFISRWIVNVVQINDCISIVNGLLQEYKLMHFV